MIRGVLSRLSVWHQSESLRRIGLATAGAAFLVGLYLSLTTVSVEPDKLNWRYLAALVLLGAPLTLALNTWVFWLSAKAVGDGYSYGAALRWTVLSSAANFLPMPGGPLVRVAALKASGGGYGRAVFITTAAALFWLAVALFVAGVGLAEYSGRSGYLLISLSGAGACVAAVVATRMATKSLAVVYWLAVIAAFTHAVSTLRFWLAFQGIGLSLSAGTAAVVAASGTAGAVVGFVPGGLGLNEGLAALLAELSGISAALGFLAAVLNRLANYAVRGPLALILIWHERRPREVT